MRTELPYSDCYAVISAGFTYNFFKLSVNVRNPNHKSGFRDDYEFTTEYWFDQKYEKPCGDGVLNLDASGSLMPLPRVEAAIKALRSYMNKRTKSIQEHGHDHDMISQIITSLRAAGVKEVRVHTETSGPFPGWDNITPINVSGRNTAIGWGRVGYKLTILEAKCWEAVGK